MFRLILSLAYKNAFLRRSRALLLIVMIAVSMSMMLALEGLYDGMTASMVEKTKRSDSGEVSIYAKEFRQERTIQENIKDAKKIQEELLLRKDVKSVSLRLQADGLCATAKKSSFATLIGIELEDEQGFGDFSEFLETGSLTLRGHKTVVGKELAKDLKLKIGSKVIFSTQDMSGEITAVALRVSAIVQTNNIALDKGTMYVNRELLRKLLQMPKNSATQIAIRSDNTRLAQELSAQYPDLDVKSFLALYPMMEQMQEITVIFNSITFFIVMLVVFIGIMGVTYVSVLERVREFGVMRSLGMPYSAIKSQILFEALFVAMVGYILGAFFGFSALYYLENYGLDLKEFADGLESFGYASVLYADMKYDYFITSFAAIFIASVLSVLLPLRRLRKMSVIEATKLQI